VAACTDTERHAARQSTGTAGVVASVGLGEAGREGRCPTKYFVGLVACVGGLQSTQVTQCVGALQRAGIWHLRLWVPCMSPQREKGRTGCGGGL